MHELDLLGCASCQHGKVAQLVREQVGVELTVEKERVAGPDRDGATRWHCPFCAGLLKSRALPKTLRRPKNVPLVPVDEGCARCCDGIITAMSAELPPSKAPTGDPVTSRERSLCSNSQEAGRSGVGHHRRARP